MQNNKKISKFKSSIIVYMSIVVLIIIVSLIYVSVRNRAVTIQKRSFSETHDINFKFNDFECKNINKLLANQSIEDENYYGFSSDKSAMVDLYQAYSAVNLLTLLEGNDLGIVKEKLSFLSNANIQQFDFLNIMYYVELCEKLNIKIDYEVLNNELVKYYDKNTSLFYLDETDSINVKLIATAMVKNVLKENLSEELFNPEVGIEKAYREYSFAMQNNVTLYNSGGDVLYCASVYKLDDIINKEELENWYKYWKEMYEGMTINSPVSAVQYAEYLNVARIFEEEYSVNKLQEYYDGLKRESVEGFDELNILYNFIKNIDVKSNDEIVTVLNSKVENVINNENFVVSDIDVKSTAYGVMLAKKSGFKLNEEKINNYIRDNYERNFEIKQNYDRTYNLYYNLILDQLINGYEQNYDSKYFQQQVDVMLESIDYESEYIAGEIISTRRIVEIVSDLQVFDVDIKFTNAQKKKIYKGFKKVLEIDEIANSSLINDIYIVDKILSLNMISDEKLVETYNNLTIDGGTRAVNAQEIIPDVNSTYQFFVSLSRMNNFEYLSEQKKYIGELKIEDGIFMFDSESEYYDLSAVVYANTIYNAQIGGDKFD